MKYFLIFSFLALTGCDEQGLLGIPFDENKVTNSYLGCTTTEAYEFYNIIIDNENNSIRAEKYFVSLSEPNFQVYKYGIVSRISKRASNNSYAWDVKFSRTTDQDYEIKRDTLQLFFRDTTTYSSSSSPSYSSSTYQCFTLDDYSEFSEWDAEVFSTLQLLSDERKAEYQAEVDNRKI